MSDIKEDRWISVKEAATYLSVRRETVLRWIKQNEMPSHRVGNLHRFKLSELDRWIHTHKSSKPRKPNPSPKETIRLKALIIDDDEVDLENANRVLGKIGFETILCRESQNALELLDKTNPNFLLLDLLMPKLSGAEILRRVREQDKWKDLPVVILTGHAGSKHLSDILPYSPVTILEKPIDPIKLNKTVKLLIQEVNS